MKHHIWCNSEKENAIDCKLCACLNEKFPAVDGETAEEMAKRYFPSAKLDSLNTDTGEDWHRFSGALFPDDCEVCNGESGGIRGNENIVDGVVMCDYCSAENLLQKRGATITK